MSYIKSVKELHTDDLKGLITQYTGFKEGTSDFKKCEESLWSLILDRYYPSVNEQKARSNLVEFIDKFRVHGFPQKARNLAMLIEAYENHPYFKNFSNTEVQWGLIHFLTKLSFKPTNALEDDQPLDLNKKDAALEETFNWAAHLKEGLEKFYLPSEGGDSLSDWSEDETEADEVLPHMGQVRKQDLALEKRTLNVPHPTVPNLQREPTELPGTQLEDIWWRNLALRESPASRHPEANYCLYREKVLNCEGKTRILNEYKVMMELIYVLNMPSECYFIEEIPDGSFKVKPNISTSTLSPKIFTLMIEENFCVYLPHIKKLQLFCQEIDESCFNSNVPAVYRAYSGRLQKILNNYSKKLLELERRVNSQDDTTTLMYLLTELYPFLYQLKFLSKLHEDLLYKDWRERDVRSNAFRLLSILYEHMWQPKYWEVGNSDWPKRNLLLLFVDSLKPFLDSLGMHMAGTPHKNSIPEFFLTSTGEIIVPYEQSNAREFWETLLKTASSAIVSCAFLLQLDRYTTFFKSYDYSILSMKFIEKLYELLLYQPFSYAPDKEMEDTKSETDQKFLMSLLDGSHWDSLVIEALAPPPKLFKKTTSDRLSELLIDAPESTYYLVNIAVKNSLRSIIEEYMEPKGFAAEILLNQLKLLTHLRVLFLSVQATSIFSTILISQSQKNNNWKTIKFDFEDFLSNILPQEYVHNFKLNVDIALQNSKVTFFDLPDHIKLYYKVDSKIIYLISEESVGGYAVIFSFLLKTRLALALLNRLIFERIAETTENNLRLRRLCSLRTWLTHLMNSLNLYFSTFSDTEFQTEIKDLCFSERKICTIYKAHMKFIEKWKFHCFLTEGHPCYENILELISLCARLKVYWKMEQRGMLADYYLDDIEKNYFECRMNFAQSLQLYEDRLTDSNDTFSLLYDEVMNNLPPSPEQVCFTTYFTLLSEKDNTGKP